MKDARPLAAALREPETVAGFSDAQWTELIAAARAERLLGSLAYRLGDTDVPERVASILADACADAEQAARQALWEAEVARRALAALGVPIILLKGTAYAAAGLPAAEGRSIGDLDILVPREALAEVERALLGAGWEWVKEDAYDDLYYRRWMHELPPLIHRERDRMIDVHHTILPLTARPKPDTAALVADRVALDSGLCVLSPADMIVHAAAHLFADGDLAGGLRNLWDIDRLLRHFATRSGFWAELDGRAALHGLSAEVQRSLRLANRIYGSPTPEHVTGRVGADDLFEDRLLARNGWSQETRPLLRLGFYIRSHWLRMPPLMLARHLWTKARR
jgi:hypothetical protein